MKIQKINLFSLEPTTIEIDNVHLKKSALAGLELPIEIKEGIIGKLTIYVPPLIDIKTKPWKFHLEQLFILTGPSFRREVCIIYIYIRTI